MKASPPLESIGEMKVTQSAYSAQLGHTSGGTVEYTSKSGTNEFHGSGLRTFSQ